MQIRFSTIQHWVPALELSAYEVADLLTHKSYEVDEVTYLGEQWNHMVVGYVESVEDHPDADNLRIAIVDVGEAESRRIVCGADNLQEGLYVPVAKEGAVLPDGTEIESRKIRGEQSYGMICSANELQVRGKETGIKVLSEEHEPGTSLATVFGDEDYILEIDTTAFGPRASDSMSYYGVSREIANLTGKELKTPERTVPEESGSYTIKRDAELCKRYLTLEATTVSHLLMPRLRDIGELSNSPLVDLSNYVMEEMGQPVHIFDTRKLSGSQITIRTAEPGEGFVALGEQQLVLTEDDIVITDEEKIIALAGVIGGESSKVDEYTDSIVVESAQFNSAYVQRTARRLNLLTDAAKRFEKGLPVESARMGIERVAWYLEQMQQFVVKEGDARMDVSEFSWHLEQERLSLGGITDEGTSQTEHTPVALSSSQVRSYLGVNIEDERIQQYLEQIECIITNTNDGGFWGGSSESAEFEVTPPYYRLDLTTPEELIEEVGRLYGYDEIPAEMSHISLKVAEKNPFYELCKQLRYSLKALGYNEVHTYPYASEGDIKLQNPVSSEAPFMRNTLRPGMRRAIQKNTRYTKEIRLFEIAAVFFSETEHTHLSMYITPNSAHIAKTLQTIRTHVHTVLQELSFNEEPLHITQHTPGEITMYYDETEIGTYSAQDGILELSVTKLYEAAEFQQPQFEELPTYPAVKRDITLAVAPDLSIETLDKLFQQYRKQRDVCRRTEYTDVYYAESYKNVTFHLEYQSADHSLTDEEVNTEVQRLVEAIQQEVEAEWV